MAARIPAAPQLVRLSARCRRLHAKQWQTKPSPWQQRSIHMQSAALEIHKMALEKETAAAGGRIGATGMLAIQKAPQVKADRLQCSAATSRSKDFVPVSLAGCLSLFPAGARGRETQHPTEDLAALGFCQRLEPSIVVGALSTMNDFACFHQLATAVVPTTTATLPASHTSGEDRL